MAIPMKQRTFVASGGTGMMIGGSCCKGWSGFVLHFQQYQRPKDCWSWGFDLSGIFFSRESSQGFQYQKPGAVLYWWSLLQFLFGMLYPFLVLIHPLLDIHNLEPCDEIRSWAERIFEVSNV